MNYLNLKRRCELEQRIQAQIYNDNRATCHFDYQSVDNQQIVLILITSNPTHNELFTLYTTDPHCNEIQCLDEVLVYLDKIRNKDHGLYNYQVQWYKTEEYDKKYTSFFTGKNIMEILNRFFENKDPDEFVVISIQMRPIS